MMKTVIPMLRATSWGASEMSSGPGRTNAIEGAAVATSRARTATSPRPASLTYVRPVLGSFTAAVPPTIPLIERT